MSSARQKRHLCHQRWRASASGQPSDILCRIIQIVSDDPYRLTGDFYGIGFFSADKVALSLGLPADREQRIRAAVKHVLAAGRDQGHCYLLSTPMRAEVASLLGFNPGNRLAALLEKMEVETQLKVRLLPHS